MSLDQFAIDLAIRTERYYRDTAQWAKLRGMWHPDPSQTLVSISWIQASIDEFIAGSQGMAVRAFMPFHTMQPVEIVVHGDRALATTLIGIRMRFAYQGVELDLESWAHQVQRFVKIAGEWKLVRFEAIYLRDSVTPAFPLQRFPEVDQAVLSAARPCVRYLTWQFSLAGGTIRQDVPGYDDEKTWRPLVERNTKWLETGGE